MLGDKPDMLEYAHALDDAELRRSGSAPTQEALASKFELLPGTHYVSASPEGFRFTVNNPAAIKGGARYYPSELGRWCDFAELETTLAPEGARESAPE